MITSMQNPLIKQFKSLERARERKNTGLTVLEGARNLKHAYNHGWEILNVLYCESKLTAQDKELLKLCELKGAKVEEIGNNIMENLSSREGPLGLLAILKWEEKHTLETLELSNNPFVLIAESIEKPGNLGVLIRTASASGVDAVILCDSLTSFHDPACINSSIGAVFHLPCITTTSDRCLAWLKDKGITPVVTSPDGKTTYTECNLAKPIALVMGNEHTGASEKFMKNGETVKIDMFGEMPSLNVTIAGAIFMFEAVRQRKV